MLMLSKKPLVWKLKQSITKCLRQACHTNFCRSIFGSLKISMVMGDNKAKAKLAEKAFPLMTAERIRERDPDSEVENWFRRIGTMIG